MQRARLIAESIIALEVFAQGWVFDLGTVTACGEMPFGHIGRVQPLVDKHVVPGCVFRGAAASDLFVPLFAQGKGLVRLEYDAAVSKPQVFDDLTGLELHFK